MLTPEILLAMTERFAPRVGRAGSGGPLRDACAGPSKPPVLVDRACAGRFATGGIPWRSLFGGRVESRLPVSLDVFPIKLKAAEGYYGIYHRNQTTNAKAVPHVTEERYLAELQTRSSRF
ncbi:MAG: hypothetical protein Ct9H300mP1_34950 [Planctomycetaceae bacterium]|nr:MAG: hypothetical protein Ct9H300mP1_34950 [Planctomycetaceae bacterium]